MKKNDDKALNWIYCPFCNYKMNISYSNNAKSIGIFTMCKNKQCKEVFEIKK